MKPPACATCETLLRCIERTELRVKQVAALLGEGRPRSMLEALRHDLAGVARAFREGELIDGGCAGKHGGRGLGDGGGTRQ